MSFHLLLATRRAPSTDTFGLNFSNTNSTRSALILEPFWITLAHTEMRRLAVFLRANARSAVADGSLETHKKQYNLSFRLLIKLADTQNAPHTTLQIFSSGFGQPNPCPIHLYPTIHTLIPPAAYPIRLLRPALDLIKLQVGLSASITIISHHNAS